jgi:hypothetical protein
MTYLSGERGLFALPLRKINPLPQAQALDFHQGRFDLGKRLGVLPGGLQHKLVASPQHDGPATAVEAFDDGAGDGIGGHQCLAGLDCDTLHISVCSRSLKCSTLYSKV